MNTSLLVLTQHVYAKKQDGGFYSGKVDGKESENMYNIEFSDCTRSAVREDDLVWLGFYSLPPHTWPKSPAIHPVRMPKEEIGFCGGNTVLDVDEFSTRRPESLRFLSTKEWALRNEERRAKGNEQFCSSEGCRCTDEKITSFESDKTPSDRTRPRQMRSSVLRLNRKALSQEISQSCAEDSAYDSMLSSRLESRRTEDELAPYHERRKRHFSTTSLGSTSPHPSPYDRYDPPYLNTPCLTPPSTPGSQPPPLFVYKPYETAAYGEVDGREWISMDRRNIGGEKRRRRDNMKKCRKVYGIDNRDLWCTQCKWKKACSRFQIGNYRQTHF